jgi:hypothetical protein
MMMLPFKGAVGDNNPNPIASLRSRGMARALWWMGLRSGYFNFFNENKSEFFRFFTIFVLRSSSTNCRMTQQFEFETFCV